MTINLTGKKALVGGSTQGLGKAIALELANCGATVTLMARNETKLKAVLKELNTSYSQKHNYLVVDFYNYKLFHDVTTNFFESNEVDILVNNTNGPEAGGVLQKNNDDYQKAFDLLFKTTNHLSLLAIKHMKKNGFGRIINAASISVKEPLSHLVLSNAIRGAVSTWSKTLATEVAPFGITVNTILTGIFDTERIQQLNEFQAKAKGISLEANLKTITNTIPIGRLGKPEEFGYLVSFLASEYAAFITGSNIAIDGGILKSV